MAEPNGVPRMAEVSDNIDVVKGCSIEQLQTIMQLAQLASALLDPVSEKIIWCTADWLKAYPWLGVGALWSQAINESDELVKVYESFDGQDAFTASLYCKKLDSMKQLSLTRQQDGIIVLLLSEPTPAANDMHLYMQARESMFTTSRTISVSEMATTLAHEIKQPISTISNILKGLLIRLSQSGMKDEMMETALNKALDQAEFTDSVINRIRDFTQARRPQQQVLDMGEVLRESLSLMDWFLSANQCNVELNIGDGPLLSEGDPTMLQQVIANLVRNGVEAMYERLAKDRILLVECQRRNESIRISIKDFGHGLKVEEKTLFVPFTTSKANGMGVGLNICRSFVELHQGRLWLSPNSEGGCTSHVELPRTTADVGQSV